MELNDWLLARQTNESKPISSEVLGLPFSSHLISCKRSPLSEEVLERRGNYNGLPGEMGIMGVLQRAAEGCCELEPC